MSGLTAALGVGPSSSVAVVQSINTGAVFEWGASSTPQRVHASPCLYGEERWDAVRYRDSTAEGGCPFGVAKLAMNSVDGVTRCGLIFKRLVRTAPDAIRAQQPRRHLDAMGVGPDHDHPCVIFLCLSQTSCACRW